MAANRGKRNATEEYQRLFDRVAEELVHGHRDLFDSLRPAERKLVIDYMAEVLADGRLDNSISSVLWELDYVRRPVGIEEFIRSDDYLGRTCAQFDAQWVRDLQAVFAPGSSIYVWVMRGAIGIGKTVVAMAAIAYTIYRMSCLRDPARYYGLLANSLIVFGIYSITKRQVADAGYWKLREYIDNSRYFQDHYPRDQKLETKIVFQRQRVQVVPGSRQLHVLGLDLFSVAMDEANFMSHRVDKETGKTIGQAYELFNATSARIMSRFMRPGGVIPGLMLLMSSEQSQTDFLANYLASASKNQYRPGQRGQVTEHLYVSHYALWEIRSHRYSRRYFTVEVGDRVFPSRILGDSDTPRPGAQTVQVPMDFYSRFVEDVDQHLRDIAGVATVNVSPFIRDPRVVHDAVDRRLSHPFTKTEITLSTDEATTLPDYFLLRKVAKVHGGAWVPKRHPGSFRYVHLDLALTGDCLGIGMVHPAGWRRVETARSDGTVMVRAMPLIEVDFVLRVRPPVSGEIDISKATAFVEYLRSIFPIRVVSFDEYQSRHSIQILRKAGFDAKVTSVDRDDKAYLGLRSAFYERRMAMYAYEPLIDELLDLQRDVRSSKVDHPERASKGGKGSKDVADGLCGAVWDCMEDEAAWREVVPLLDGGEDLRSVNRGGGPEPSVPASTTVTPAGRRIDWDRLVSNLGRR